MLVSALATFGTLSVQESAPASPAVPRAGTDGLFRPRHGEDIEALAASAPLAAHGPLGAHLVASGLLSREALRAVLAEQRAGRRRRLGEMLRERGLLDDEDLRLALARQTGIPAISLKRLRVEDDVLALVPRHTALARLAVPLHRAAGMLYLALNDPFDEDALRYFRVQTGLRIVPLFARAAAMRAFLADPYRGRFTVLPASAWYDVSPWR